MSLAPHVDEAALAAHLDAFRIETPSWGYADTGTRFGKFGQDAAAGTWREKLEDAAQVHKHTGCCPTVAVHVLWDFSPGTDAREVAGYADKLGVRIGSINPNVFQDPCYKFGSLANRDPAVRERAKRHILDSIEIARQAGSKLLSLWFADGTNYPGQADIRRRKHWMADGLREIHDAMPPEMTLLVEYKPFEPAFYHTDIADWGMAAFFARAAGPRAKVLVDTGHHLHGTNIEHIVAFLLDEDLLGGFHFNDRKYADDDLMIGSIDPYQLFRIFFEIASAEIENAPGARTRFEPGAAAAGSPGGGPHGKSEPGAAATGLQATDPAMRAPRPAGTSHSALHAPHPAVAYMIDQSHNLEPKIQAMIHTVMTAQEHYAKALLVDRAALDAARGRDDVILAQRILQDAFTTDVRPFLAEYREARRLPADPLFAFRESGYEERVARERKPRKQANSSGYAWPAARWD